MLPFIVFLVIVCVIWGTLTMISRSMSGIAKQDELEVGSDATQVWLDALKRSGSKRPEPSAQSQSIRNLGKAYTASPVVEPQTTPNATPPRVTCGELLRQFVAAVFVVASVWMIYEGITGKILPHNRMQEAYVSTKAAVQETAIDDDYNLKGRAVFNPRVRLRYSVNGAEREEWCKLDWSSDFAYDSRSAPESALAAFPVGGEVTVWYDPEIPSAGVVDRDVGLKRGWIMIGVGSLLIIQVFVLPIGLLILNALKYRFVLLQTTGQVLSGAIIEAPAVKPRWFDRKSKTAMPFQAVLTIEYECGEASPRRGTISIGASSDRQAAENILQAALTAYPIGEQRAIWRHPNDKEQPTLAKLTFGGALFAIMVLLLWTPFALVKIPLLLITRPFQWLIDGNVDRMQPIAPASRWSEHSAPRRTKRPASRGHDRFYFVIGILTLSLTIRYVLWPDYRLYYEFQQTSGTILESEVVQEANGGFEPRVKFSYTAGDLYCERRTQHFWYAGIRETLRTKSKDEAASYLVPYPVGGKVNVWYDPGNPGRARIRLCQYWHLYPLLIPSLLILILYGRRLWRRGPDQPVDLYEDAGPRHSGLGIASFLIGVIVVILEFTLMAIGAFLTNSQPGRFDEPSDEAAAFGLGMFVGLLLAVLGLFIGVRALLDRRGRKKLFAVLGVLICAPIGIGGLVFSAYVLAMVVKL